MKKVFLLSIISFLFSCSSDENENNSTAPVLSTANITNITLNGASSGGNITSDGGADITSRGVVWSTSQNPTIALSTKTVDGVGLGSFTSSISGLTPNTTYYVRAYATNSVGTSYGNEVSFTTASIQLPVLTTTAISNIGQTTSTSGGTISSDGGGAITVRGVVWSTSQNPTVALSTKTTDGSGTGTFTSNIIGLTANTQYYVRAYATNSSGTAYGNEITFNTLQSSTPSYPAGTVHCNPNEITAIVNVSNPITGKIWMDRNLGASQVATIRNDVFSYGDLYQWGRRADGHQCRNSATTSTVSSVDDPSNGNFIIVDLGTPPRDWRSPQNVNLWQGVNGVNNPCPSGYRLPTDAEFNSERASWSIGNSANAAFSSPLKLPVAGVRDAGSTIRFEGNGGFYWTSTINSTFSRGLRTSTIEAQAVMHDEFRAQGQSVRCIKN